MNRAVASIFVISREAGAGARTALRIDPPRQAMSRRSPRLGKAREGKSTSLGEVAAYHVVEGCC